jgi:bleomycin hydrolase
MKYQNFIFVIIFFVITISNAQNDSVMTRYKALEFDIGSFNSVYHLPPLNQDTTSACWSFATLSFIESEMVRLGKEPVKLAVMFPVYCAFIEKAKYFVNTKGHSRFAPGDLFHTVFEIIKTYGIVPLEAYRGQRDSSTTFNHDILYSELDYFMAKIKNESRWDEDTVLKRVKAILNEHLGTPPDRFLYHGKEYTPHSFRDECVGLPWDQYISLTSFTYAPFDSFIVLDVPDNWKHKKVFFNVPLDHFFRTLKNSILNGYSVAVDCDISEPGRISKADVSIVPKDDIPEELISQSVREYRFQNGATTDDHLMHLVGIAETDESTWFLVKDSWRDAWEGHHKGYFIFHEDYVRLKVLAFMVHKDALKWLSP